MQESGPNLRITDNRGSAFDLSDVVISVEQIGFAEEVFSSEVALESSNNSVNILPTQQGIDEVIIIQPIIAANSDGSNVPEFFGNSQQEAEIISLINQIFAVSYTHLTLPTKA